VGGEEFAIILPETSAQNLMVPAKRILNYMNTIKPSVAAMAERREKITVSLGLVNYQGGPTTVQDIFQSADKSLYHAKRHGRNRVGTLNLIEQKTDRLLKNTSSAPF
jgi:diguanylate cyclase (GGDEF)-like protein